MLKLVPLGGKVTVTSNISYFMKGLYYRYVFNVGRVIKFEPVMSSEPGDHHFPNLLLCLSNFTDGQYLSFLVCSSHHFIVDIVLV